MKKHRRQNYSPQEFNILYASQYAWVSCMEVMMLMLYEQADFTADGLKDFLELAKDYLDAYTADTSSVKELEEEFAKDTGLHLDEAFRIEATTARTAVRLMKVLAIKAGALALWSVADWEGKEVRRFVYRCWDMIPHHAELVPRIREMQKVTKVTIRVI